MTDEERLSRYLHGSNVFQRFLTPHGEVQQGGLDDFVARVNAIRRITKGQDRDLAQLASETLVSLRALVWPEELVVMEGKIGEQRRPVGASDPQKRALMLRVRELSSDRDALRKALSFLRNELDREQLVRRVAAELTTERAAMRAVAENALLRKALVSALEDHPKLEAPIRNAQLARIFREAGLAPVLRTAATMTKADLLRMKGMGPGRYATLMAELEATGLELPHLLRDIAEEDPAPLFAGEGIASEVAWDPLGSALNRELDVRMNRILSREPLPGEIWGID